MRLPHLVSALVVSGAALVSAQEGSEIVLPRQMGAINDYAAVLGSARADLEAQLETIRENFNVQIVVLASIYDPFDDAAVYARRIWESWRLGKRTVLLVFVKEQAQNVWAFEFHAGDEVRELFQQEQLGRLRDGLKYHLERKHIKTALEESVAAVQAMLDGTYGKPPPRPSTGFQFRWVFILLGGLIGLGGIALGVRAFLRNRCPRCGTRLRSYRGYRSTQQYTSCPFCGYSRRS